MSELAQLSREISRLENQLAALHQRRVEILEAQLREAQMQAGQITAATTAVRRGRPPASASTAAAPAASADAAPKKKAAKKKTRRGGSRKRMSSAAVTTSILDVLGPAGAAGLSCKEISDTSGVNYQTVAKKLKEMPGVKKTGKLKKSRYSIKG